MENLVDFADRIRIQLANASRKPYWNASEAARYMVDVAERRKRFDQMSSHLVSQVIQPRLETFASQLHATTRQAQPARHCECWLGYSERFPVTSKIEFVVEHDSRLENVFVRYHASMMPVFIKFDEHDKLTAPFNEVDDQRVAKWVEKRLLEFLDAYLRIDRGRDDFEDETATDPVCGMRIMRSAAFSSGSFRGHLYHFCSDDCQKMFTSEPTAYVQVRPM